ncbi:jg24523 [Pararge aegeria aegeria]|uniref:Jg24523 protein n=1 Tax=Pararge aegeria aegeria TaxID=348720 RepID=A0A8S4R2Y3_9NEOP|nr:jg24523 [Pararge aegeria aegeria]
MVLTDLAKTKLRGSASHEINRLDKASNSGGGENKEHSGVDKFVSDQMKRAPGRFVALVRRCIYSAHYQIKNSFHNES